MEKSNIVYEFCYNPDTYDSGFVTISIHYSKEGADKAMHLHKMEEIKRLRDIFATTLTDEEMIDDKEWFIQETIILP